MLSTTNYELNDEATVGPSFITSEEATLLTSAQSCFRIATFQRASTICSRAVGRATVLLFAEGGVVIEGRRSERLDYGFMTVFDYI
jgi:hypothetical protein